MNRSVILLSILVICFGTDLVGQVARIKDYYQNAEEIAGKGTLRVSFVQEELGLVQDYEKLDQIILIRHGEPAINKKGWKKRTEAINFIRAYDSVGVYPLPFMPAFLYPGELGAIQTSSLNRARHTAELIFGETVDYIPDSIFREFERKIFGFPNIKLPLKFWKGFSRFLWFMGANKKGIESFSQAKSRSRSATDKLEQLVIIDNKAVLVAHGLLNRYLVKNFRKRGWEIVHKGGKDYLATWLVVRLTDQ